MDTLPPALGFAELPAHNDLGGIQSLLLGANMRRSRGLVVVALAFSLIGGAFLGVSGSAAADPSPSSSSPPTPSAPVTAAPTGQVTTSVSPPAKTARPTVVSGFAATLNQYWQVSFHGCLALRDGVPGSVPSLAGLTIQYAADRNGPWRPLGGLAKRPSQGCGHGGLAFSGVLPTRLNYAYYRATYAGGRDRAGTGYLGSVGGEVLAWKYGDQISSFATSKRTVGRGTKLTVSGQLRYYSGKWQNHAGQQVLIILRPHGSGTWYWIAKADTNSAGRFSATFTDPVSATWSAEYTGNSTHLAAIAAEHDVRVR
jgi:hypothetical protein